LAPFKTILYPYIEGHNAIEQSLSTQQWIEFGTALKKIHTADIPLEITTSIQQENFSSRWRNTVKTFLEQNENEDFDEPVAKAMAAFLKCKGIEILDLVKRAEQLVQILQLQSLEYTLCHADIHGWNLLVAKDGALFIVDWDTLILAPKERDLMFIGAGLGDSGRSPQEEEILFYQGYGQTNVNQVAIAYYRYERIIEDIAVYCEQIICSNEGEEDRKQSLVYLKSNFLPNNTIERAYQADKTVRL
jgi:spectinomycin phosphotransferase